MAEKQVLNQGILGAVMRLRQYDEYPTAFRIGAGAFHAINTVLYGLGGATLLLGREATISTLQQYGAGIQDTNTIGLRLLILGSISLIFALLNAWAAITFFTSREASYWYLVLFNIAAFLWTAFLTSHDTLIIWIQLALYLFVAIAVTFDPQIKAEFGKGALAVRNWERHQNGSR